MKNTFFLVFALLLSGCNAVVDFVEDSYYAGCIEVSNSTEQGIVLYVKTGQEKDLVRLAYGERSIHEVYYEYRYDPYGQTYNYVSVDLLIDVVDEKTGDTVRSNKRRLSFGRNGMVGCDVISVSLRRLNNGDVRINFKVQSPEGEVLILDQNIELSLLPD